MLKFVVQHLDACESEKKEFATTEDAIAYIDNTENISMLQYDDVKKDYIVVGRNYSGIIEYPDDIIEEAYEYGCV